jgi:hypothetical protein
MLRDEVPRVKKGIADAAAIAAAVPALREARDAESRAIERLAEVAARE